MARIPMVTRTIITTKATVLALDTVTAEPQNLTITVPRTYKDDEALLKAVKAQAETDTLKMVSIVDREEIETLYGMTEQEFINHAKVLPARQQKENN